MKTVTTAKRSVFFPTFYTQSWLGQCYTILTRENYGKNIRTMTTATTDPREIAMATTTM
jgi:hypothetical protein